MVCPSDRLKIEPSGSGGLHYIALFLHMIVEIYRPLSPTMYSIGSRSYVEHCHSYESIQFEVAIPINVE